MQEFIARRDRAQFSAKFILLAIQMGEDQVTTASTYALGSKCGAAAVILK